MQFPQLNSSAKLLYQFLLWTIRVSCKSLWIYVNTLDKNLGFLLISATIDNPNINAQGFLPEGEELKAS